MKRGFIFSITAIFFVALVLVFFSLYIFVYQKPTHRERILSYEINNYKFISGQQSNEVTEQKWCSVHLIYDPDQDSAIQSTIIKKEYCEKYGSKRFV